jgi:hypothetical protein
LIKTGDLYDWRSDYSQVLLNSGKTGRVGKERKIIKRVSALIFFHFCIFTHLVRVGKRLDFDVVARKERNGQ